jgi:hypothetical protein
MNNWTEGLSHNKVHAVREALEFELRTAHDVQSYTDYDNGWSWVVVLDGRYSYTVTVGSRGGVKSVTKELAS